MKADSTGNPVTQLLQAISAADKQASDQLIPLVYDELRRMARSQMAREGPGQTLQPPLNLFLGAFSV